MATLGIILFGRRPSTALVGTHISASPSNIGREANNVSSSIGEGPFSTGRQHSVFRMPIPEHVHLPAPILWIGGVSIENLRLTLAAQVFTIPLILYSFHQFSLVAPLANLAIEWVIAPVTLLGWVTVFLGFPLLYAGQIVAWVDWILLKYLIRTIYFMSRLPFASFIW